MISQSLTAVVLPAGAGPGGSLRASIYLAPRLSGAHLLSEFPDWLHWTALVHQHGLRGRLGISGEESHDHVMPKARPEPDTDRKSIVIDQRE